MNPKKSSVGLPFYIFVTVFLMTGGVIGVQSLVNSAQPGRAALFIAVFGLHLGLYWVNVRLHTLPYGSWVFYLGQTAAILGIFFLLRGSTACATVIGITTITMLGHVIGYWGNTRRALALGSFFTVLAMILFYFLFPLDQLSAALFSLFVNGSFIVILMTMFNQQLAERQKATDLAEALESSNAKLTASAAKIEQLILQTERQRMARELHDTLAQGLAGLSLQLEAVKMHLQAGRTERAAAIVDQALVRAHHTLAESRAAIDNLRAGPENLADAVREKIGRFIQATGIPCPLDLSIVNNPFPTETTGHALRVLDEALANIGKHASATQAAVNFKIDPQRLELEIRDNGKGFDVDADLSAGHYGLVGMRERARLAGGGLTIQSYPEQGTTIRFCIPDVQENCKR